MPLKPPFRKKKNRSASQVLEDAVHHYQTDTVSLGELMTALHERGFGILLVIFVLPNCVPIPMPGLVSLTAFPLFFISWQLFIGKESPWLPGFISRKRIKRSTLAKIVASAAPRLKKIEKLLRARLSFASSDTGERVIGAFCLLFTCCVAVPLPWTNLVPGYGIMIMALGLLSRDGITILIGMAVGMVGVTLTGAMLLLGGEVVSGLLG